MRRRTRKRMPAMGFTIAVLIGCSLQSGCGSEGAHVVGTEEEYAKIRNTPDEIQAAMKQFGGGPSKADVKKMVKEARSAGSDS